MDKLVIRLNTFLESEPRSSSARFLRALLTATLITLGIIMIPFIHLPYPYVSLVLVIGSIILARLLFPATNILVTATSVIVGFITIQAFGPVIEVIHAIAANVAIANTLTILAVASSYAIVLYVCLELFSWLLPKLLNKS
jgi:hypothetical protein